MTPEDASRRRRAKLVNERLKLAAAFLNTFGVAFFIAAFLSPAANAGARRRWFCSLGC